MKLKCIIVDDEPIARKIIESYCSHLDVEVIASCHDAMQAKSVIDSQKVDIAFIDINMPVLNGIAFVKTIRTKPQIIFTTAYKEYAHEAFDLDACDYLLKPFSLERFILALDKAKEKIITQKPILQEQPSDSFIYLRSEGKIFKIDFETLQYAEASGNHVKLVMEERQLMPSMTFNNLVDMLPKTKFLRVHRSFIVNKSKILSIEGNRIFLRTKEIPIGSSYRDEFLREIGL